jgi:DNA-binding response OmpR family regulator
MRLLLAENDPGLRSVLQRGLTEEGFVVDAIPTGNQALDHLCTYEYVISVVDWPMPGTSGLDIITWARGWGLRTPFLMLTANDGRRNRGRALEEGSFDYLVKPFDYEDLLTRLRTLLHRSTDEPGPLLRCGSFSIDPLTRQAFVGGEPAALTSPEFATIELLVRSSPAVVNGRVIAQLTWPEHAGAIGPGTLDIHMARLRAKLARSDARIETFPATRRSPRQPQEAGYRILRVPR